MKPCVDFLINNTSEHCSVTKSCNVPSNMKALVLYKCTPFAVNFEIHTYLCTGLQTGMFVMGVLIYLLARLPMG